MGLFKPAPPFFSHGNLRLLGCASPGVEAAGLTLPLPKTYIDYNITFLVDDRHTAHVERTTNELLCLYAR